MKRISLRWQLLEWGKLKRFFLPVWNVGNLDQSDSLYKNERLMILQNQKSYADVRFRFRDFLQFVTVPPKVSECVDVPSESLAHLFFEPSER